MIRMDLPRKGISLLQAGRRAAVSGGGEEGGPTAGIVASSRVGRLVASGCSSVVCCSRRSGTAVFIVAASVPTIRAHSVALRVRNSEEGRSAIMQAEVIILAAARRELDSARAIVDVLGGFIADCTAAVATACRYLGAGGSGDDQ